MNAAELLVRCLENEGVDFVFGLPGEENVDVMDALLGADLRFVLVRHEQGAAFMADVYGRLTGRPGVCLSTLGPGATNLMTGVADADVDSAPLVAIAGQSDTRGMHKESHQHLDLVRLFEPVTKYAIQVRAPETVPEIVRKAFKLAGAERPGATFVELPEDVAVEDAGGAAPLRVQAPRPPVPPPDKVARAAELISSARAPLVVAGHGVVRAGASDALARFADALRVPVATTFMAKGAIPASHPLSVGTVGMQSRDAVACGFDRADVIVCVGYDMVEWAPEHWHPTRDRKIVHVSGLPAEVDDHYVVEVGVVGDVGEALDAIAERARPADGAFGTRLREVVHEELSAGADDDGFPLKPQRIVADLRRALAPDDVVVCDVGAHKLWMARLYEAEAPNTCLISNGFAAMGIALPGAIAAKLVHPARRAVAVCGDAGFLMNVQELETAVRLGTPLVALVWNDAKYGLIEWHQLRKFGRESHVAFDNPDLVALAESFGARGERVERAADLAPALGRALAADAVTVIDCPVDYAENMKLTERLGAFACRI